MRTQSGMSGHMRRTRIIGVCLLALAACARPDDAADAAPVGRDSATPRPAALGTTIEGRCATTRCAAADDQAPERPPPFAGRDSVTLAEWFEALQAELPAIAASDTVRAQFDRLRAEHDVPDDAGLYADFVRVRTAFEATRAGGYWGLEWRVTDRQPQSDEIWTQWQGVRATAGDVPQTSAIAECDELSALFAFIARGLGLSGRSRVGLLWPTSNHTVAVWAFDASGDAAAGPASGEGHRREVRVVVPTSQIFLDSAEGLDTGGFDPWVQARIFDYARRDAPAELRLPAPLARGFVQAVRRHGATSAGELQSLRNRRAHAQREAQRRAMR